MNNLSHYHKKSSRVSKVSVVIIACVVFLIGIIVAPYGVTEFVTNGIYFALDYAKLTGVIELDRVGLPSLPATAKPMENPLQQFNASQSNEHQRTEEQRKETADQERLEQDQKERQRQAEIGHILSEYRQSTLNLINEERAAVGAPLLKLGVNEAAQQHAENMLANCFAGHWGVDGLKPHMRYTLAGGQQYNAENVMGLDYCITWNDGYQAVDLETAPAEAVQGFMDSEGHRDAMLDPYNKFVNIGMAYDTYNIMDVHQFEYGHMQFHDAPSITNGVLELSGWVADGVRLDLYEMLPGGILSDSSIVTIYYDPPPSNLTRGQLAHTYSACTGEYVATIMPPLPDPGADWYWESTEPYFDTWTEVQPKCTEPRDVPADAVAPVADWDAERVYRESKWASMKYESVTYNVWYKHAEHWDGDNGWFNIRVDISPLLQRYGSGVYTVTLWGTGENGTDVPVSDYALFYKTKD